MYHFLIDSENSISSQGQEEESSAASFSDIPASVLSRLSLTADASCYSGNGTDACQSSQSGTMCEPSKGDRGEDLSMSSAADSPVKTFQQQDAAQASPESVQDSGRKWPASLAKWDQGTYLWRTHQFSLRGDLELFSETWPRWGLMRGGECWERMMPGHLTRGNESGFWLSTPTCSNMAGTERSEMFRIGRADCPATLAKQDGGKPSPECGEWLMMWPIGWTALHPLAMGRFQEWLHSHGGL